MRPLVRALPRRSSVSPSCRRTTRSACRSSNDSRLTSRQRELCGLHGGKPAAKPTAPPIVEHRSSSQLQALWRCLCSCRQRARTWPHARRVNGPRAQSGLESHQQAPRPVRRPAPAAVLIRAHLCSGKPCRQRVNPRLDRQQRPSRSLRKRRLDVARCRLRRKTPRRRWCVLSLS